MKTALLTWRHRPPPRTSGPSTSRRLLAPNSSMQSLQQLHGHGDAEFAAQCRATLACRSAARHRMLWVHSRGAMCACSGLAPSASAQAACAASRSRWHRGAIRRHGAQYSALFGLGEPGDCEQGVSDHLQQHRAVLCDTRSPLAILYALLQMSKPQLMDELHQSLTGSSGSRPPSRPTRPSLADMLQLVTSSACGS